MSRNNLILFGLIIINISALFVYGFYLSKRVPPSPQTPGRSSPTVIENTKESESPGKKNINIENSFTRKVIRFESIVTNLAGDEGRRIVKISIEAGFEGNNTLEELNQLKPRIRDLLMMEVGARNAEELTSDEGKNKFRDSIKEKINSLLKTGKIIEVYLTNLELN